MAKVEELRAGKNIGAEKVGQIQERIQTQWKVEGLQRVHRSMVNHTQGLL